jgi:anti-sigma factor RsiW
MSASRDQEEEKKQRMTCAEPDTGNLLAAYEMGVLAGDDRRRFEEHLGRCPWCVEQLYELAPHVAAMRADPGGVIADLDQAGAPGSVKSREESANQLRSWWQRLNWRLLAPTGALAAAATILILFVWNPETVEFADLAQLEHVEYLQLDTRSEGLPEAKRLYARGMENYAARRYEEAAALLSQATAGDLTQLSQTEREQIRFFRGLNLLLSEAPAAARPHLEEASRSTLPVIADRARWYLAQAHLLLEEPEEALPYLETVAERSRVYADRAATLRDEVKARLARRK